MRNEREHDQDQNIDPIEIPVETASDYWNTMTDPADSTPSPYGDPKMNRRQIWALRNLTGVRLTDGVDKIVTPVRTVYPFIGPIENNHTEECENYRFCFHAATGDDVPCICKV